MNLDFEQSIHEMEQKIAELQELGKKGKVDFTAEIFELQRRCETFKKKVYQELSPWQRLQVARHPERPVLQDYLSLVFDEFIELHGDRQVSDDRALIAGFATIDEHRVILIGHNKGKTPEENAERNFGMAKPDGYRKALRMMRLAERWDLPVITAIDTSGAFPGLEAEERGQAEAIAHNLTEMARLNVPIISIVTGEGGSGGAIGIGVGDVNLMLTNAVYSVISPEGCASILWRDAKFAPQAAEALRITADSLKDLGIVDEIVREPVGGAHSDYDGTAKEIKKALVKYLDILKKVPKTRLLKARFEKYASIGKFAQ